MTWAYAVRPDTSDIDAELEHARQELKETTKRGLRAARELQEFFESLTRDLPQELRFPLSKSMRLEDPSDS